MPEESKIRSEFVGTFNQGTYGALYVRLFDIGGTPIDATTISISIVNTDTSEEAVSDTPTKYSTGIYLYDWLVAGDQAPGEYTVTWTYEIYGQTQTEVQRVVVSETVDTAGNSTILSVLRLKLEQMLHGIQAIPLNFLQSRESSDQQNYRFTFPRWNQSAGVQVYRNQNLITSGFDIDYHNGIITFDQPQLEEDYVNVSCVFRFFSDQDLDMFLFNGLNMFNIFPPHTPNMTFNYLPQHYVPPVLFAAAGDAIRTFMQAIIWKQNKVLFETPEDAKDAFSNYNTIKENYEKQWETLANQKKFFPYAGLFRVILQPQFTLPGGRARFFRYLFGVGI